MKVINGRLEMAGKKITEIIYCQIKYVEMYNSFRSFVTQSARVFDTCFSVVYIIQFKKGCVCITHTIYITFVLTL